MTRKKDTRTSIALRMSPDLHAALTHAARERDLSVNYLIVAAVRDFLPRLIPVDQLTLVRNPQGERHE